MFCLSKLRFLLFTLILMASGCVPATTTTLEKKTIQTGDHLQFVSQTTVNATTSISKRHQTLEILFQSACLPRTTFTKYDKVLVRWPNDMTARGEMALRIMRGQRIYAELHTTVMAGTVLDMGHAYQFSEGEYELVLIPTPVEYHVEGLRMERRVAITIRSRQEEPILVEEHCQF